MKYISDEDLKPAIDFPEREYRFEAESRVIKALTSDPLEALEIYTKNSEEFHQLIYRLKDKIIEDEYIFDTMVTRCLQNERDEIQEELERL